MIGILTFDQLVSKRSFTIPNVSIKHFKKENKSMSTSEAAGVAEISVKLLKSGEY